MNRPARQLALEILLPMLVLCAAEAAFSRYVARTPTLPLPRLMASAIDTGKYLAFRSSAGEAEPLDVLFFGLSPMMRVSGSHLQEFSAERWNVRPASFNFAAPFHAVEFDRRVLNDIVLPARRPSVVVYGLGPINLLHEPSPEWTARFARALPAFDLHDATLAAAVRDFLFTHVDLIRYRNVIRDALPPRSERPADPWMAPAKATNEFGDIALLAMMARPVRGVTRWERKYVERFVDFDARMATTRLFDHLAALAEDCRRRGIELVVLNSPIHPIFLEMLPEGRRNYDAFVDRLAATARRENFRFFDPAPGGIGDPTLFQDTHHHNAAGMTWLTEQTATYLQREGLLGGDRRQP